MLLVFLVSAIRLGVAFLFGATGEIITEKSGHLNLGIPGVMCVGASLGCYAEFLYFKAVDGNLNGVLAVLIPVVATIVGGAVMGLIFSILTVTFRANQNVTGLALTTFGIGVSKFIIDKVDTTFSKGSVYFTAHLPIAEKLGWFGELFLSHGIMFYMSIIIAIVSSVVLSRTRVGLHLRSVGENPATADAAGIDVSAYRYGATCVGCAIAGLGGLSFIMDYLHGNWEYMVDAIGWLAIALVIFTMWRPWLAIIGSIVFGGLYVASNYVSVSFAGKEIFKMLPYIVTIIVLIITSIRSKKENQPPASLGLSYFREDR